MSNIGVQINSEIVGELFLRKGPKTNISNWVENILMDYLDRTEGDDGWSDAYYEYLSEKNWDENRRKEFGDPKNGFRWTPIFLPNGTEVSMEYKREKHIAIIKHEKLYYKDKSYTPSEFASAVANNTSRNAWRDLYIRLPGEARWSIADELRRKL